MQLRSVYNPVVPQARRWVILDRNWKRVAEYVAGTSHEALKSAREELGPKCKTAIAPELWHG